MDKASGKELAQLFIVISGWVCYAIMVFTKLANPEGFIVLTGYIVKKFLDIIEVNNAPKA